MATQKPYVTVLYDKIAFPSKGASRTVEMDGTKRVLTISPFELVVTAEESLAVKIAVDKGVVFRHIPTEVQHNIALGKDTLKSELIKIYSGLKAEGWFKDDFDPVATVARLEATIGQAVNAMMTSDHSQRGAGKEDNHGSQRRR